MKRLICISLLACLLVTGCQEQSNQPTVATAAPTEAATLPPQFDFHLEYSDPTVVVQGKPSETTWGQYQFPNLYYTVEGAIMATWQYGTDSIRYDGTTGRMASMDGGKTWGPCASLRRSDYVTMSNGLQFQGFGGEGAHEYTAADLGNARGVKAGDYTVFLAEDLPDGIDTTVTASVYDPNTGESSKFAVTLNWPYAPVSIHPEGLLYPLTQSFNLSNRNIISIDGVLYICMYCIGFDSTAPNRNAAVKGLSGYENVYVLRSEDCGKTWDFVSQVLSKDRFSGDENGFSEPNMIVMPDGSVVMLMRSGNYSPLYYVRSTDNCATWSEPVQFDEYGVRPRLLTLGCGVTIATYGRPGMKVRATSDPSGLEWEDYPEWENPRGSGKSCYYTDLLALDDYRALMIYTDFKYPNKDGIPVKTVLTRVITVVPDDEGEK